MASSATETTGTAKVQKEATTTSAESGLRNENRDDGPDAQDRAMVDDEEVIFGGVKMSALLTDKLAERLEEAFTTNVQSLPMLRDPEPLLKKLREAYLLNVDLVEDICARRIFSLTPFVSAKRRQEVLELLTSFESVEAIRAAAKEEQQKFVLRQQQHTEDSVKPIFDESEKPPSSVSEKDVEDLRRTILSMEKKLEKSKALLKQKKKDLHDLASATKLCKMATETSVNQVHDTMTALTVGASSLQQAEEQGREYINEHKRVSEEPKEEGGDADALLIDVSAAVRRKRSKMTLEERFENDMNDPNQPLREIKTIAELKDGPHQRILVEENSSPS